jgi:hypothetical protein
VGYCASAVYRFEGDGTRGLCAISADASIVVVASNASGGRGSVHAIETQTGALVHAWTFPAPITDLAMDAAGERLFIASFGRLAVWSLRTRSRLHELAGYVPVFGSRCAVSADGRVVLAPTSDTAFGVWNADTGTLRAYLGGHAGMSYACAINALGTLAITTGADGTLRMWDVGEGTSAEHRAAAPTRSEPSEPPSADGAHPEIPVEVSRCGSPSSAGSACPYPSAYPPTPKFPLTYGTSSIVLSSRLQPRRPQAPSPNATPAAVEPAPDAPADPQPSDPPPSTRDEPSSGVGTCVICLSAVVDCAMTPCGHASYCLPCANELLMSGRPCAICRQSIYCVQRIFF